MYKIFTITNHRTKKTYVGYTRKTIHEAAAKILTRASSVPSLADDFMTDGRAGFTIKEIDKALCENDAAQTTLNHIRDRNTLEPHGYNRAMKTRRTGALLTWPAHAGGLDILTCLTVIPPNAETREVWSGPSGSTPELDALRDYIAVARLSALPPGPERHALMLHEFPADLIDADLQTFLIAAEVFKRHLIEQRRSRNESLGGGRYYPTG